MKATADNLQTSFFGKRRQPVEIVAMVEVEPLGQRSTGVECHANPRVTLKEVEKRQVTLLVGFREDRVKVAHRLVVVQNKNETHVGSHREEAAE